MDLLRSFLLILTIPFSWIYALILRIRHFVYDKGYFHSQSFSMPVIAIGNLHFGGTGKTPLVDLLVEKLGAGKVAVCARGYGRKSQICLVDFDQRHHMEADIGEELYFLQDKHPQLKVLAANKRSQAVSYLQFKYPERKIVILDDALQHRSIQPSLRILLCPYSQPYTQEYLVPRGNLRDITYTASQTHIVIISKSPVNLPKKAYQEYRQILRLKDTQALFFSTIDYGTPRQVYPIGDLATKKDSSTVILLQGIARPEYLEKYLKTQGLQILESFRFPDHYRYKAKDLEPIAKLYQANPQAMVLSTEKDWPKLQKLAKLPFPLHLMPIKTKFLWEQEELFLSHIRTHINNYV